MKRVVIASLLIGSIAPSGFARDSGDRTFSIPEAIRASCQAPNSALICEDLQEFLDALNAERRDDAWAKEMEARIRKSLRVGGKETREILALECRQARCAVVYSVAGKDAEREVDGDGTLDELMDVRTGTVAPNAGSAEGDTIIGMLAWQKRVTLEDTAVRGVNPRAGSNDAPVEP